ncbi:MAG: IclR family transcriptional regulator [Actinobacteria bacterium]|nr:IclR family transcriptional regulator [Actinomycetota bacterium]
MNVETTRAPINQSVERAARLLSLFSVDEPELTLAELQARLGTSKATAHRYATALRRAGLLRLSGGGYTLGPRVVELAATALAGLRIVKVAGPYLERLVSELNETAVLSVWDGDAPVVVRVDDNTDRLVRINVRTGSRLPLDSAQGKIFRAHVGLPDDDEAVAVRAAGIAFNARTVEGIAALAAPVFQGDDVVATMALVGTTASIPSELDSIVATRLRELAAALSAELGFLPTERRNGGRERAR